MRAIREVWPKGWRMIHILESKSETEGLSEASFGRVFVKIQGLFVFRG
jgi:hypothetical protein